MYPPSEASILVLEDNPYDFQALNRSLSKTFTDWPIYRATNIDEMVSVISHTVPTIGIVDYHLEDATGLDAINILRKSIENIPIILVTGGVQASEAVNAVKLGAIDYIEKDFEGRYLNSITQSIQKLLHTPHYVSIPALQYRELLFERDLLRCRNGSFSLARKGRKVIETICEHFIYHQGGILYLHYQSGEVEMVSTFGVNKHSTKSLLRPYSIDFNIRDGLSGRLMLFKHRNAARIDGNVLTTTKLELSNIVRQTQHIEALRKRATNDSLTSALNRHMLHPRLDMELARVKRTQIPMSVLMLDVDYFKALNDQYGHAAGDAVLAQFADVIRQNLRLTDTFIRYGGEEFVILLPGTDWMHAAMIAERIRAAIDLSEFSHKANLSLSVTVSIGYTTATDGTEDPQELVNTADKALYLVKNNGRNGVQFSALDTAPN